MYNEFPSWQTMEQHVALLALNSIRPKLSSLIVNTIDAFYTVWQSIRDPLKRRAFQANLCLIIQSKTLI